MAEARGRLGIYLGMPPGVGKTFAMLNEGRRRKSRGADVVIGFVETYDRPNTIAQLGDLEVVPRRLVAYRGVTLEEWIPTPSLPAGRGSPWRISPSCAPSPGSIPARSRNARVAFSSDREMNA